MDILRRQYGTKRVKANQVYQDYIKDKDHVHMNSTKWLSLTGFIHYLAKVGKARIDETEKGISCYSFVKKFGDMFFNVSYISFCNSYCCLLPQLT